MSLNWDAKEVKGWKEIGSGYKDMMIYGLMFVGMQKVTTETLAEVQARVALHQRLFGNWLNKTVTEEGKEPVSTSVPLTSSDVAKFVGLTTNVSTETRAQFNKRMLARFYKEFSTGDSV